MDEKSKWCYLLHFCLESHRSLGIYPVHLYWHWVPNTLDQNYNTFTENAWLDFLFFLFFLFFVVGKGVSEKKITRCLALSFPELIKILFLSHTITLFYMHATVPEQSSPWEKFSRSCSKYEEMERKALQHVLYSNCIIKLHAGVWACYDHN